MMGDEESMVEDRFALLAVEAEEEGNLEKALVLYQQAGHRSGACKYYVLAGGIAVQLEKYEVAVDCFTRSGNELLAESMREKICKK